MNVDRPEERSSPPFSGTDGNNVEDSQPEVPPFHGDAGTGSGGRRRPGILLQHGAGQGASRERASRARAGTAESAFDGDSRRVSPFVEFDIDAAGAPQERSTRPEEYPGPKRDTVPFPSAITRAERIAARRRGGPPAPRRGSDGYGLNYDVAKLERELKGERTKNNSLKARVVVLEQMMEEEFQDPHSTTPLIPVESKSVHWQDDGNQEESADTERSVKPPPAKRQAVGRRREPSQPKSGSAQQPESSFLRDASGILIHPILRTFMGILASSFLFFAAGQLRNVGGPPQPPIATGFTPTQEAALSAAKRLREPATYGMETSVISPTDNTSQPEFQPPPRPSKLVSHVLSYDRPLVLQ